MKSNCLIVATAYLLLMALGTVLGLLCRDFVVDPEPWTHPAGRWVAVAAVAIPYLALVVFAVTTQPVLRPRSPAAVEPPRGTGGIPFDGKALQPDRAAAEVALHAGCLTQLQAIAGRTGPDPGPGADAQARLVDRLREALTWAVGFIRCNHERVAERYEDYRNAAHLAAGHPLVSGEFQHCSARAEHARDRLAEDRDALKFEAERLRAESADYAAHVRRLVPFEREANDLRADLEGACRRHNKELELLAADEDDATAEVERLRRDIAAADDRAGAALLRAATAEAHGGELRDTIAKLRVDLLGLCRTANGRVVDAVADPFALLRVLTARVLALKDCETRLDAAERWAAALACDLGVMRARVEAAEADLKRADDHALDPEDKVNGLEGELAARTKAHDGHMHRALALEQAIRTHRDQKDDDRLYEALGDGIKCDRRVGDAAAMLKNCERYVSLRCQGGGPWPTYAQLEGRVKDLEAGLTEVLDHWAAMREANGSNAGRHRELRTEGYDKYGAFNSPLRCLLHDPQWKRAAVARIEPAPEPVPPAFTLPTATAASDLRYARLTAADGAWVGAACNVVGTASAAVWSVDGDACTKWVDKSPVGIKEFVVTFKPGTAEVEKTSARTATSTVADLSRLRGEAAERTWATTMARYTIEHAAPLASWQPEADAWRRTFTFYSFVTHRSVTQTLVVKFRPDSAEVDADYFE